MRSYAVLAFLLLPLSSPIRALEPDQVYAKVAPSIVVVVAYKSANPDDSVQGSGVIIAPGQIVTNCHVIEGADVIYLSHDKNYSTALLRFEDPDRDLCQVSAVNKSGFNRAITAVVSVSELRVGQKVYAIGAPQGFDLTLSDGLISSLRSIEEVGTIIQTNAPMSHGSSGGGLFDSSGRLIGITSFQYKLGQNLNFAVPAGWILELPSRHVEREELKQAEQKKKRIAEEQEQAADEQQRLETEQRAEEERLRDEEQYRVEQAKSEEGRQQRAGTTESGHQLKDAALRPNEAQDTRRNAEAAAIRTPQQKQIDDLRWRIQAKIKGRVVVPPNIEGNPEARFEVVLLPGGDVLSATLKKSSGNPAYDAAVERAILAAQPFPVPEDVDLFHVHFRELALIFRPKD